MALKCTRIGTQGDKSLIADIMGNVAEDSFEWGSAALPCSWVISLYHLFSLSSSFALPLKCRFPDGSEEHHGKRLEERRVRRKVMENSHVNSCSEIVD